MPRTQNLYIYLPRLQWNFILSRKLPLELTVVAITVKGHFPATDKGATLKGKIDPWAKTMPTWSDTNSPSININPLSVIANTVLSYSWLLLLLSKLLKSLVAGIGGHSCFTEVCNSVVKRAMRGVIRIANRHTCKQVIQKVPEGWNLPSPPWVIVCLHIYNCIKVIAALLKEDVLIFPPPPRQIPAILNCKPLQISS